MKANELMAGNLVIVNENGLCIPKGTIVRVLAVDAADKLPEKGLVGAARCVAINDRSVSGGIWCAYLAPIPLSVEIMEKNFHGVTRGSGSMMSHEYDLNEDYFINAYAGDFYLCTHVDDSEHGYHDVIYLKELKWLHQLQQLFTICEVEKEITLDGISVKEG